MTTFRHPAPRRGADRRAALLLAAGMLLAAACGPARSAEGESSVASDRVSGVSAAAESPQVAEGTVLLELFTSQGCSSCPPADRLLSELAADPALAGRVYPLAFHVDYWNYIGWTDPFSSPRWSERQRRYGEVLPGGRVYTPQLVIDGASHTVGSRRGEIRRSLAAALARPRPVRLVVDLEAPEDGALPVTVRAEVVGSTEEGTASAEPWTVWLALWQDDLETPVTRGENAATRLHNDRVVRHLVRVGELAVRPGATLRERVELPVEPGGSLADLGVVAFAQSGADLRVHGATGMAGRELLDRSAAAPR